MSIADRLIKSDTDRSLQVQDGVDIAISALAGAGKITFEGSLAEAIISNGSQSGTAGAGTTTTTIQKPDGSADWTAGELRGSYLRLTGGGGTPALRPIIDNTTSAITVHAIAGMDDTSVFELVDPDTTPGDINLTNVTAPIRFEHCVLGLVDLVDCANVEFVGCSLASAAPDALTASRGGRVSLDSCVITGGSSAVAEQLSDFEVVNVVLEDGAVQATACRQVTTEIDARNGSATPLDLRQCLRALVGLNSVDNTGNGVHAEACNYFAPSGTGIAGSGNSQYGMEIERGGYYDVTGVSVTGTTGDVRVQDTEYTWAELATSEGAFTKGITAAVIT